MVSRTRLNLIESKSNNILCCSIHVILNCFFLLYYLNIGLLHENRLTQIVQFIMRIFTFLQVIFALHYKYYYNYYSNTMLDSSAFFSLSLLCFRLQTLIINLRLN